MNELILERKQGTYVSSNSFTFFWSFAVLTVTCVIFSQSGSCFVGETVQPRVFLCFIRYSPSRFCISFIKKATVYSTQYNIGYIIPPGNRSMRKCTRKHGKRQRAKRLLNFIQLKQVCECSTTRKLARVLSSWLVLCCFTSADASLSDVRSLSLLVLKTKALFYHLLKNPKGDGKRYNCFIKQNKSWLPLCITTLRFIQLKLWFRSRCYPENGIKSMRGAVRSYADSFFSLSFFGLTVHSHSTPGRPKNEW